jgi:hypothetical protein
MTRIPRRTALAAGLAALGSAVGCQSGGDVNLFGYTTKPPFDPDIRTVYIPVFKNTAFLTSPNRGIEVDLTEAIVREINGRRTPMRVVSDCSKADTELVGTIIALNKNVLNRDRQNFARELEFVVTAEIVWRDLRSGRSLTGGSPPPPTPAPFDPSLPTQPPPPPPAVATPVRVVGVGRFLPELGESNASGQQMAVQNLARNIVNMMEQPW